MTEMASASVNLSLNEDIFKEKTSDKFFIGNGRFSYVYGPCTWKDKICAIKKRMFAKEGSVEKELTACKIWMNLNHINLITVYDVSFQSPSLHIMMEYAGGGSLEGVLERCKSDLPLEIQKDWGTQIAGGMAYLHGKRIVHRDLKSSNIVVMEPDAASNPYKKTLKLTDFDQIRRHNHTTTMSGVGTYAWRAPEAIVTEKFSKASDVWSYGVVLWEILTRKVPHKRITDIEIMKRSITKQLKLEIQDSCPDIIKMILISCLRYDKNMRPFFRDISHILKEPASACELIKKWTEVEKATSSSKISALFIKDDIKLAKNPRNVQCKTSLITNEEFAVSDTTMYALPLELLDIILLKSYLLYILSGKQSMGQKDAYRQLASVELCWFRRIGKGRFQRTTWRQLPEFYEKFRRRIEILRNNQTFLEENIQLKYLTRRLRSADCLTDLETRLVSRQGTEKLFLKNNNPDLSHLKRSFDYTEDSDNIGFHRHSKQKLNSSVSRLVNRGGTGNVLSRNNNPDLLHLIRSLNETMHSDFIRCLCHSNQKFFSRVRSNGGVVVKATFWSQKAKNLLERINEIRDKTISRSHETDELTLQLKDYDVELSPLLDRQLTIWIWCRSQIGLQRLQFPNQLNSLIQRFTGFTLLSSPISGNIGNIKGTGTSICQDQFNKKIAVRKLDIKFTAELNDDLDTFVRGVTKLRNEIYVLGLSNGCPTVISVFQDQNPFNLKKTIKMKECEKPCDIGSSEKENCLYVTDFVKKCVWKITQSRGNHCQFIKWLTMADIPQTLSVCSDGSLLFIGRKDSILKIYVSIKQPLRSIQLTKDIKGASHAVQTSFGNFIIIHQITEKKKTRWYNIRKVRSRKWFISEVARDGKMVINRFIPSSQTQELNDPSYLTLGTDDQVFVVDSGNKRIILLHPNLEWNRILTKDDAIQTRAPIRLFYNEDKKQLIAGGIKRRAHVYTLFQN